MKKCFVCIPKDICDPKDVKVYFMNNKDEAMDEIIRFESKEEVFIDYVYDFGVDGFDDRFYFLFDTYLFDMDLYEEEIEHIYLSNVKKFFESSPHLGEEYFECSKTEKQMSDDLLLYIRKRCDNWSAWIIQEYDIN